MKKIMDKNKELNIFEQLDNMNDKSIINNNNNNNSNNLNINEDNKINNNNNTGTEERIILAISKEENQDSLDRLKKLDELSTVMDQSIITEEEMNAMEQARKDEIKSIIQKEKMDRKHLADHRMIWEESLGWNEENEKDYEQYNNKNNNVSSNYDDINDLAKEMEKLYVNENEMEENIEEIISKKKIII